MPLTDLNLRRTYDPETCPDPVTEFYAPALAQAIAYDRTTFTFSAQGLAAAAAGLAGLLNNAGKVRIICEPKELNEPTCQAILKGEEQALLQAVPPESLTAVSPDDLRAKGQLDLLTWLVAQGRLEIKVAIARDAAGGIFHEKTGIIADAAGNRLSFNGSPNETEAGWSRNYERFRLFLSWEHPEDVAEDAAHFNRLWDNRSRFRTVIKLPEAYRRQLLAAAPRENPTRRKPAADQRTAYWQRLRQALETDPASSLATIPAQLWPHQAAFFGRHAADPTSARLLLADEVGLGKTIQAASLLKAGLNQGRIARFLILAPKAALPQWQEELRAKFNIAVPRLETAGGKRTLVASRGQSLPAPQPPWQTDRLLASYQWLRQNRKAFLNSDPRYDLVIIDEAHRARYTEVNNEKKRRPNQYLQLLQSLAPRAKSLLLLTATPMQLHAAELHALLELLQPTGWSSEQFQRFYDPAAPADQATWRFMRDLYRPLSPDPEHKDEELLHTPNAVYCQSELTRNPALITAQIALMRRRSPLGRLLSRHTRATLRHYAAQGLIKAIVPQRQVSPVAIPMPPPERELYDRIDDLVREVYEGAPGITATTMGFVMTSYRKRLSSSPRAYALSCRRQLDNNHYRKQSWDELKRRDEDDLDDDPEAEPPGTELTPAARRRLQQAVAAAQDLEHQDSKLRQLLTELDALTAKGHRKIIIFTQFKDTLFYLRESPVLRGWQTVIPLYGQDEPTEGPRAERLERLKQADRGLLLSTETGGEALNLQFCSAMVNYDMPWNPMTLEQRIGRIDRIGQEKPEVDIVNLFYRDTAEWDAYEAMREHLKEIGQLVGEYQPILANRLPQLIRNRQSRAAIRQALAALPPNLPTALADTGIAIDITAIPTTAAAVTLTDLQRALTAADLLPDGWRATPAGGRHWELRRPDGAIQLVTTDPSAWEYGGALEWFGPGSAWWPGETTP